MKSLIGTTNRAPAGRAIPKESFIPEYMVRYPAFPVDKSYNRSGSHKQQETILILSAHWRDCSGRFKAWHWFTIFRKF